MKVEPERGRGEGWLGGVLRPVGAGGHPGGFLECRVEDGLGVEARVIHHLEDGGAGFGGFQLTAGLGDAVVADELEEVLAEPLVDGPRQLPGGDAELAGQLVHAEVGIQVGSGLGHVAIKVAQQRGVLRADQGGPARRFTFRQLHLVGAQPREYARLAEGVYQQIVDEQEAGNGTDGGYRRDTHEIPVDMGGEAVEEADKPGDGVQDQQGAQPGQLLVLQVGEELSYRGAEAGQGVDGGPQIAEKYQMNAYRQQGRGQYSRVIAVDQDIELHRRGLQVVFDQEDRGYHPERQCVQSVPGQ